MKCREIQGLPIEVRALTLCLRILSFLAYSTEDSHALSIMGRVWLLDGSIIVKEGKILVKIWSGSQKSTSKSYLPV